MEDPTKAALGAIIRTDPISMTLHAETLLRILYLKDEQNYLTHPKTIVKHVIKLTGKREKDPAIKRAMKDLLTGL